MDYGQKIKSVEDQAQSQEVKYLQQRLLLDEALSPLVIGTAAFVIACLIFLPALYSGYFKLWIASGCCVLIARLVYHVHLKKEGRIEQRPLQHWVVIYNLLLLFSGVLWGSLVLFWSPSLSIALQLQLILFPVALAAGAVSGYASYLKSYIVFLVPCLIPLVFVLAVSGQAEYQVTVFPAVLYLGALVLLARNYEARLVESLSLQFQNKQLVEDLSRHNEELLLAKQEAESASVAKSEFLARMSHEIRTPMNGVLGMTEVLQNTGLAPGQKKLARSIYSSGELLLELINDLLDVTKLEAKKLRLESLPFDVREVVDQVVLLMSGSAKMKNLQLKVAVDETVPEWVAGDALRLRQILSNLLSNAIKFTDDGSVSIGVSVGEPSGGNVQLIFKVEDSGIGISTENLDLIFEAFTQADGTTTRKFGGTGLGLSIAKELAELMHGDIVVSSQPGQGSVFTVTVMVRTAQKPQNIVAGIGSDKPDPAAALGSVSDYCGRLLLVEDNLVNQQVMLAMLELTDFDVTVANNGKEAVDEALGDHFDLILMDCQMPVMDGYTATKEIRGIENYQQTPIIAVTANLSDADKERCMDVGMNDYLAKPLKQEDLLQAIEKWTLTFRQAS